MCRADSGNESERWTQLVGQFGGGNKVDSRYVRNPVFLDRQSGFDWTEIPVLSGQWFSVFLPAVVAV